MDVPHGRRQTTTLIASLRLDGPINGDWTCTGSVQVSCSCYAALFSKTTGDFKPDAECLYRRLAVDVFDEGNLDVTPEVPSRRLRS